MLQSSTVVATVALTSPRRLMQMQMPFHHLSPSKVLLNNAVHLLQLSHINIFINTESNSYIAIPLRVKRQSKNPINSRA